MTGAGIVLIRKKTIATLGFFAQGNYLLQMALQWLVVLMTGLR